MSECGHSVQRREGVSHEEVGQGVVIGSSLDPEGVDPTSHGRPSTRSDAEADGSGVTLLGVLVKRLGQTLTTDGACRAHLGQSGEIPT